MTKAMDNLRENTFLAFFARHRVAANLLMGFMLLVGYMGLSNLNTQIFPDVTPGAASVSVIWDGAGAEAVLDRVTAPLEREILELNDIDSVTSDTRNGVTSLSISFNAGTGLSQAMNELRTAVDSVGLPAGAERPRVTEFAFAEPVMFVLFSYDGAVEDLRPLLDDVKTELERRGIPEIALQGLDAPSIDIEITPAALAENNWTISGLAERIRNINDRYTAGQIGEGENRRTLVIGERYLRGLELAQLPMGENRLLGDVAQIMDQAEAPPRQLVFEGRNAVMVEMSRATGMDSSETAQIYRDWHDEVVPTLPAGVEVYIFSDASEFVRDNIELLVSNGLYGLLLVLATLFLFLNLRVAFWTAMGIPVALFGTMALLYFTGGSLNFFSMFAMLMALGIIVDNAIVVGEETQSMVERNVARDSAASLAVSRMYAPIIASSLTTMAAFSPLLVVPGVFGELLRPIPLVIIFVLIAALIECFLILPGHLHKSFGRSRGRPPAGLRLRINRVVDRLRDHYYRRLMTAALRLRLITVALAVGMFTIAIGLVAGGQVPFSVDLEIEAEEVFAEVEFIEGTAAEDITAFVQEARAGLLAADAEFVERYEHPGDSLIRDFYYEYDLDAGTAFFMARLPSPDDRPFSNADFLTAWDAQLTVPQSVERLSIDSESGGGAGASQLNIRLVGDDADALRSGTTELTQAIAQAHPDLRNIEDTLPATNRQLRLDLTPRARDLGLSEAQLAAQLATAVDGTTVQSFNQYGVDVDIRVRLAEAARNELDLISWMPVQLPNGNSAPLSDLARFTAQEEPSAIVRRDGRQAITITADPVSEDVDTRAIQTEIERNLMPGILAVHGLEAAYETGQDAAELLDNLVLAAWAALAMIYIILAFMFQSYTWPLAVMSAIPLAMTGAVFGHWALGLDLNFLSIFGLFGLAGIVINGSIILISRYRELLEEGTDRRLAIIEASCQRFRPVVLTTLTTVMGLVPILLETSVQAQLIRSMATSLAFGLGYGAVLVLLVIPAVLSYVQSAGDQTSRFIAWVGPDRAPAE